MSLLSDNSLRQIKQNTVAVAVLTFAFLGCVGPNIFSVKGMSMKLLESMVITVDSMMVVVNARFIFSLVYWCAMCRINCTSTEIFKIQSFKMKVTFF